MNITNLRNSYLSTGIKELWHSEEKDLSPFIAEHLNEITDVIGIPFGDYILEKRVGRYESDIVADITTEDSSIAIIENKIGSFDHDHLGKAITYMSYLNAKTIVWICDSFNDEHIKAINYLNKITGDEYSFFGIAINVYKFNKDNYSYEFNVVAKPDYIEKSINSSLSEKSIATHNTYLNYWNKLKNMLPADIQDKLYITSRGDNYAPLKVFKNMSVIASITKKGTKCAKIAVSYKADGDLNDLHDRLNQELGIDFEKETGKKDKSLEYLSISQKYNDDPEETLDWTRDMLTKIYKALG